MSRLLHACVTYLKPEQLELPMGLTSRLILGDQVFVDQFSGCVRELGVSTFHCPPRSVLMQPLVGSILMKRLTVAGLTISV